MVSRSADATRGAAGELSAALALRGETPRTRAPRWALTYRAGDYPPWAYTVDIVGLSVSAEAGSLRAMLARRGAEPFAGHPAWPGRFVEQRGDPDGRVAARREIAAMPGVEVRYLETLDTYDENGRDPRQFAGEIDPSTGRWIERGARIVSKAFLALLDDPVARGEVAPAHEADSTGDAIGAGGYVTWVDVYALLPWEDVRGDGNRRLARHLVSQLRDWAALGSDGVAGERAQRVRRAWGRSLEGWNEELANERYALLLEAGLVEEAWRDRWGQLRGDVPRGVLAPGQPLAFDHRRMLADAVSRIRSKMRYVPGVLAALAGREVTLPTLQRVVETAAGRPLHTSNFRRVVTESHGLLRPVGRRSAGNGPGPRPALYAFPRDVEYARLDTAIRPPWAPLKG